jgi:hypothetical protein
MAVQSWLQIGATLLIDFVLSIPVGTLSLRHPLQVRQYETNGNLRAAPQ